MTAKERVLITLACREADRVPINYSANAGIDARLKTYYGLHADDDEGLRRVLGVDFRGVGPRYTGPRLHAELPGRHVDPLWGWHTRWVEHETGGYWDYCDFPLREAGEEAIDAWPMPSPDHYDYGAAAEACARQAEYAVYAGGAGLACIINTMGFLCGMAQVLIALADDDPAMLRLTDRYLDIEFEVTRRTLEAARGGVDFVWIGEDLGSQQAPLLSLGLFRRHIRPRHQRFIDLARAHDLPVMIHTCGSSSWAYEDYIAMGVRAVDTLQPEALNMSPAFLKARFGGRLAFHGCISTAGPVAYGTVDEVTAYCRETLEIMMPGGGYCFAPTHSLQDNSPTENVVAMYEAAHRYGRYR